MSTQPAASSEDSEQSLLEQLKTREQWICWREEERDGDLTKVPVKPFSDWDDHPFASSTDEDTWGDYESARAHHERDDTQTNGIGYVFDADGIVCGIDLDDCRDPETGETDDWAANIIDQVDSYFEVSPSGTGYHGFALGFLPGDKTRAGIDGADGHIEMYDESRFFTVTLDHVEGTSTDVQQANNAVQQVYEEHIEDDTNDHTDQTSSVETSATPVDLEDEELIEKAKNAKNGRDFEALWNGNTSGYESHSEADMALCNHLAFWTGCDESQIDSLFRSSGLMRDKWDESRGEQTYGERTIENAISNCTDVYEPPEETAEGHLHTDLRINNGTYGTGSYNDNDEWVWEPVSTFTLAVNAFLDDPDSDEMLLDLTVVPASNAERPYDVAIAPSVFNDVQKFKNEVCTGRTTTFSGGFDDLNDLRLLVGQQDAPHRTGTRKIGMHDDELVTPSGVYGDAWDIDDPAHRYIKTGNSADNKWQLGDDGDYDADEVARILELLPQTRDEERFLPALGWWYSVLLAPWIREWEGELPMLMVSGDTGAGKTSTLGYLYKAIGMDGSPGSARDTQFALIKQLSSTTNIPVWLDEYKPGDMASYKQDQMQDLLRKATRGGDEARGNADQTVTTYRLTSPVVLSGEQEIQGSAEERRAIRTQFRKATTGEGADTAEAWAKLAGGSYEDNDGVHYVDGHDPREHAKAIHQYVLALDKGEVKEVWQNAREYIHSVLSDAGITGVGDLEQQALQMIKFGLTIYRHFADTMGADLDGALSDDDIDAAIEYIAGSMGEQNRTSHVDEFLELVAAAADDGSLRLERDYEVVHAGKENEELRLKLEKAHHTVSEYIKDHGLDGYDVLNKPQDYKSRMSDMADENGSYVLGTSVRTSGLNRCVAIDMSTATEEVAGFNENVFRN